MAYGKISKIVRLGRMKPAWTQRGFDVFCKIEFHDGKLSITGVEGPLPSGNARGSCGQIDMHLRAEQRAIDLAPGWNRDTLSRFFEIWQRWHLNDLTAGSPAQEQYLSEHPLAPEEYAYPKSHYDVAKEKLAAAGLEPDASYLRDGKPYSYGSAWLHKDVPTDVLAFLANLPDTDKKPAWV